MSNQNRRVKRTRAKLHSALMQLIKEKSYDLITIQDITNRAELSRATFYLHYNDKDSLLTESVDGTIAELLQDMLSVGEEYAATGEMTSRMIFQHVADNRQLYAILLTENGNSSLTNRIRGQLAQGFEQWLGIMLSDSADSRLPFPLDLLSTYLANSTLGLIAWWLENDMPYSVAYMAALARQLNMFGTLPMLMGGYERILTVEVDQFPEETL